MGRPETGARRKSRKNAGQNVNKNTTKHRTNFMPETKTISDELRDVREEKERDEKDEMGALLRFLGTSRSRTDDHSNCNRALYH